MTALLVIGAVLAFIVITITRSPILRAIFTIMLPLIVPFLFSRKPAEADGTTSTDRLSDDDARNILGVSAYASRDDIIEAHHRLMKQMHPDRGGSSYFATRINMARDTLLKHAGVTIENPPQ